MKDFNKMQKKVSFWIKQTKGQQKIDKSKTKPIHGGIM